MSRGRIAETTYRVLSHLGRAQVRHTGCRAEFLAVEIGIPNQTLINCLFHLARYGWVERTQRGWYRITERGRFFARYPEPEQWDDPAVRAEMPQGQEIVNIVNRYGGR